MPVTFNGIVIADQEIELTAVRSQGAGGQNVNKVATAIHLRFDIKNSSLDEEAKQSLLTLRDSRISKDGVLVIKAQRFRTQEQNREDALERMQAVLAKALVRQKARRPTKPTRSSKQKRMDIKTRRGMIKSLRGKTGLSD